MSETEKETKVFQVRVIRVTGDAALVEWQDGGLKRCLLPVSLVKTGAVDAETLAAGIEYGLPWEEIITLQATPASLAENLRVAGIWTYADMQTHPQAVFGALQATYGVDLGALYQAASKAMKERK